MIRTCPEIAEMIGCHKNLLAYHLKKKDAPMATERMKGRRVVKYYDVDEVRAYWKECREIY